MHESLTQAISTDRDSGFALARTVPCPRAYRPQHGSPTFVFNVDLHPVRLKIQWTTSWQAVQVFSW
jgi:hypothetical protein